MLLLDVNMRPKVGRRCRRDPIWRRTAAPSVSRISIANGTSVRPGSSLRPFARPAQGPRLHGHDAADAGPLHRRQRGDLRDRQFGAAAAAAGARTPSGWCCSTTAIRRPGSSGRAPACPTTTTGFARRTSSRSWRSTSSAGVTIGGEGQRGADHGHGRRAPRSSACCAPRR